MPVREPHQPPYRYVTWRRQAAGRRQAGGGQPAGRLTLANPGIEIRNNQGIRIKETHANLAAVIVLKVGVPKARAARAAVRLRYGVAVAKLALGWELVHRGCHLRCRSRAWCRHHSHSQGSHIGFPQYTSCKAAHVGIRQSQRPFSALALQAASTYPSQLPHPVGQIQQRSGAGA